MAKNVKPEEKKADDDKVQLDQLIQSGQSGEGGEAPNPTPPESQSPPADPPSAKRKGKSAEERAFAEEPRRSGDRCPRPGCLGFLGVMSTYKSKTHRIRHLCCDSCKKVGGKEVIPL